MADEEESINIFPGILNSFVAFWHNYEDQACCLELLSKRVLLN